MSPGWLLQRLRWYVRGHLARLGGSTCPRSRSRGDEARQRRLTDLVFDDIRTKLALTADDVVLDVGCADGTISRRMRDCTACVVGVDTSSSYIAVARRRHGGVPNLTFHVGDVQSLPLADDGFSKVCCYSVLQYLPARRLELVLNEIRRVTRPGGVVLMGDVFDAARRDVMADVLLSDSPGGLSWLVDRCALSLLWPLTLYDRVEMTRAAEATGFEATIHEQSAEYPYGSVMFDAVLTRVP